MASSREGPWAPGRLYVDGATVETDPLATFWVEFDQVVSDWKQERAYVDARDVSPKTFPHHPSRLLGEGFPRLRALLAVTPVLALGDAAAARAIPGARVYRVGFVRTADDYFTADAEGPGLKRHLGAPFLALEDVVGARRGGYAGREALIDRVLSHLTGGRLTRRSLDLAEMWSALVGGPSMFIFEDDERREYLDVLEASLEEAFARADEQRAEHEAIEAALREAEEGGAARVELPGLGWAERWELPRLTIAGKREPPRDGSVGGVIVDCDGKAKVTLPAMHGYRLRAPVPAFVPAAMCAWQARAMERHARAVARATERRAAEQRKAKRKGCLALLVLAVVLGGPCAYMMSKSPPGGPCKTGSDCRGGYCRKHVGETGETGTCTRLCSREGRCGAGRVCQYDPARGARACLPALP
ncbi:MAG: hypothetical protein ACK4N5_04665 [Myxococcales bacterium]